MQAKKMNNKTKYIPTARVQLYWMIAAGFLLAAAIKIMNEPDEKLINNAKQLGGAMFFAGLMNLMVYYKNHSSIHGSHWLLADGLCTLFLSFFPIANNVIIPGILPFFFGIWELFTGIIKIIEATELREESVSGWYWFAGIGLIELMSGVASLLKPVDDFVGMNHVIAIIFTVQCCGFVFKILIYHHLTLDKLK